jgi:hypothetical protein
MRLYRLAPVTLLAAFSVLAGCADGDAKKASAAQNFQPLVMLDDWSGVDRDADPFVSGDAPATCVGPGFRVEEDDNWLEVDTGLCNWVTLTGTALHAVEHGQLLELDLSHYDLNAAAPATAELRLTLEGCDAWEKSIPIPSAASVYVEQFPSPCALKESGRVLFHLNNHGQNTYQLRSLSVFR